MTMPPDTAQLIRDQVLPTSYRDEIRAGLIEHCPCQWGPCGHCEAGNHNQCSVVAWGGAPRAHGDSYIINRRGQVTVGRGVPSTEVWRAGRPCRWICPCGCTPIGYTPPPAPTGPAAPEQLDLFAALPVGAVRP